MTPDQFCFWLQGLFELCPELKSLTETQVKMIRDHLNYVFEGKPMAISTSSAILHPSAGSVSGGGSIAVGTGPYDHTTITTVC